MIIDFTVTNYRSIKDAVTLTMEATGAKGKSDNVAEITLKNGKKFRLLKTAVLYGANASGKSNILQAFWTLRILVQESFKYDANASLELAQPFELAVENMTKPTELKLNFIADGVQYSYYVSFNKQEGILDETLNHYPDTKAVLIYKRNGRNFHAGTALAEQLKKEFVNPKRLVLSEAGNEGHPFWEGLRNYFTLGNGIWNIARANIENIMAENAKWFYDQPEYRHISKRLEKLIQLSDLGIRGLGIKEEEIALTSKDVSNESETYTGTKKQKRFKTYHDLYDHEKLVGRAELDLNKQASVGTRFFVGIGAEALMTLAVPGGRVLWMDELGKSLHPYLSRFIVHLFQHPHSNPNNSQLIFATHETTLLDRNTFRKDQIWITKKDEFGSTKLYSVDDIQMKGLREDIPFDKWYMSGKFGGLPHIKELEFIFSDEKENTDGKKE